MLLITFAKWQLPDGTFLSTVPTIRTVAGPPGLTVIVQMAWRHVCPEGRSIYFQGFARVRRVLATGETEHRFLCFTAMPCPHARRMHVKVDWAFGGTAQDDDFDSEWYAPCCVHLPGDGDDLRDADMRARSSNDEGRAFEGDDAGASGAAGGDAA